MKTFPKPLSVEEEKEYLERHKEGDQSVRNMLIEHNIRPVAHVVKKYQGSDHDMRDLLFVGTIGLIRAANTLSADKGSRLATYTAGCVENETLMLLWASRKYSREVSPSEPIGVDKSGEIVSLMDVTEMDNRETLGTIIFKQGVRELYEALEPCLTEIEKAVLGMRYGLYRGKKHTQWEITGKLGIFRSYASRIEKRVVEKIWIEFAKHN